MRKTLLSIFILCAFFFTTGALSKENPSLEKIKKATESHNHKKAIRLSNQFLKKYPHSKAIPDVHYMIALNEESPAIALKKFRIIINNYRYYKKNDQVCLKICEILNLLSKWKELKIESSKAIKKYSKSKNISDFILFNIYSCINLGDYNEAAKACLSITNRNKEYHSIAKTRLASAYIDKKITGLSRKYIYSLRKLLVGYKRSEIYPSALFLAGSFYKESGDYNRAYSAFSDLIKNYPDSPEALYAKRRVQKLMIHKPKKIPYLPETETIESRDSIDIKPEYSIKEKINTETFFALSIGPFDNLKRAKQIKIITSSFGKTHTIKLKSGYILYTGMYQTAEKALQIKIRLAEEEGINGRIVRIQSDGSKKYIYGE